MLINRLKMLLGYFNTSEEYWIPIKDIKISKEFQEHPVSIKKLVSKEKYYRINGTFKDRIILDKNFVLVDGYSTYTLTRNMKFSTVPVYFKLDQEDDQK